MLGELGGSRRAKQGWAVALGKRRRPKGGVVVASLGESGGSGLLLGRPAALFRSRRQEGLSPFASCRPGTILSGELGGRGGSSVAWVGLGRPGLAAPLRAAAASLSHGTLAGVRGGGAGLRPQRQEPMGGESSRSQRHQGQQHSRFPPGSSAHFQEMYWQSEVRAGYPGRIAVQPPCCRWFNPSGGPRSARARSPLSRVLAKRWKPPADQLVGL